MDYTTPTYMVEYGHMSYEPQPLDPFDNVVSPFSRAVWAALAAAAAAAGAAMAAAHHVYRKGVREGDLPRGKYNIRREIDMSLWAH